METTASTLSLQHDEAADWNQGFIQFQTVLEQDLTTDLMSLFPGLTFRRIEVPNTASFHTPAK